MDITEGFFIETVEGLIFDVKGNIHPPEGIIAYLRYIPLGFFMERFEETLDRRIEEIPLYNSAFKLWKEKLIILKKKIENLTELDRNKIIDFINTNFPFEVEDIRERKYTPEADSVRENYYLKVYDLASRYTVLDMIAPEYIFTPSNYDFPLQYIPTYRIKTIYDPREYRRKIKGSGQVADIFCEFLEDFAGIACTDIGISGSEMVGLCTDLSDIDAVIFGTENSYKVYALIDLLFYNNPIFTGKTADIFNSVKQKIPAIRKIAPSANRKRFHFNNHSVSKYTPEDLATHFNFRGKDYTVTYEQFIRSEIRKHHQLFFDNIPVFIRFLEDVHAKREDFYRIEHRTVGRIGVVAEVINANGAIFTPGKYRIKIKKILKKEIHGRDSNENNLSVPLRENIKEIYVFRGRFLEHAYPGEIIYIETKLEKYIRRNLSDINTLTGHDIKVKYVLIPGADPKDRFYILDSNDPINL